MANTSCPVTFSYSSIFFYLLFLALYSLIRGLTDKKLKKESIHKTLHHAPDNTPNYAPPLFNYKATSKKSHTLQYDAFQFYQKKNFMSNRERRFFKLIYDEFHQDFFVFSQVRMVDIIVPIFDKNTQYNSFIKAFRSISQYHIDFLIVNKNDFSIICAIELDDYSHDLPDRVDRDQKVNMIFKFTGITLLRSRNLEELLNKIRHHIQHHNDEIT
ncbi:TPA: DUF2726 domain-containing protein [Escherichia coli]|nr:DUF2726 domain-containing protein [Escherichia coli]